MVPRIIEMLIAFILINVSWFVRIMIIQGDTSLKEFKVLTIIVNIAFVMFAVIYIAGGI